MYLQDELVDDVLEDVLREGDDAVNMPTRERGCLEDALVRGCNRTEVDSVLVPCQWRLQPGLRMQLWETERGGGPYIHSWRLHEH